MSDIKEKTKTQYSIDECKYQAKRCFERANKMRAHTGRDAAWYSVYDEALKWEAMANRLIFEEADTAPKPKVVKSKGDHKKSEAND